METVDNYQKKWSAGGIYRYHQKQVKKQRTYNRRTEIIESNNDGGVTHLVPISAAKKGPTGRPLIRFAKLSFFSFTSFSPVLSLSL